VGKLPKIAINDYSPQFPLRLMNKDFDLILNTAAKAHVRMPATEAAFYVSSEELAVENEEDFSAVLRRMEEAAGISNLLVSHIP
jgi:3-hydroxyisobutyrate dehydrogenase-like beta-hydroxyacid dehydrogenase